MDLTQPLQNLVEQVPGALGAVLIDNEGEAITYFLDVDSFSDNSDQIERARLISAYHRIWLNNCLQITKQFQLGKVDHIVQKYESGIVLVKALKDNHALVLIGQPEMYPGQGMLYLDETAAEVNEDL